MHKHEMKLTRWAETGKLLPRRRTVAAKKRFIVLIAFAGIMMKNLLCVDALLFPVQIIRPNTTSSHFTKGAK